MYHTYYKHYMAPKQQQQRQQQQQCAHLSCIGQLHHVLQVLLGVTNA
jgi:hypothetical protein